MLVTNPNPILWLINNYIYNYIYSNDDYKYISNYNYNYNHNYGYMRMETEDPNQPEFWQFPPVNTGLGVACLTKWFPILLHGTVFQAGLP